ncbi:glycosyltransferase family protein [Paracoccus aminophilus]|uniref:Glycosyl transferase n=1 Tax=Paracoccus aminophilus JCM 7686 TaxID=1367847 RepID=S5Y173_PARAH|nr:glycosyltransferase [Paracoccus aminophilus]AGT11242.1 glycosyl transferase [Paracoccus aminophilus JCM 7686]
MTNPKRFIALEKEIIESGLFDARWYMEQYPDVARTGLSALTHFVRFGMLLNRDPGATFSVRDYIFQNPTSANADVPPFLHYLREGRQSSDVDEPGRRFLPKGAAAGRVALVVTTVHFADFHLRLRGWVLDEDRPGLPLRLNCTVGSQPPVELLARQLSSQDVSDATPAGAMSFELGLEIFEKDAASDVILQVVGTDAHLTLAIAPAPRDPAADTSGAIVTKRAITAEDKVIGNVETVSPSSVTGWALCTGPSEPDAPDLILTVNGQVYSQTRCTKLRPDVQKVHGGDGYVGYAFEIAPNLLTSAPLSVGVEAASGESAIRQSGKTISLPGMHLPALNAAPLRQIEVEANLPRAEKISVIILNRNGAGILRDMLDSAERVGELSAYEWIVLDHQSTDDSEAVCNAARERGCDLRFIDRKGNFSFSESNNYGAALATGDLLLFANNDLIFREPLAERIRETMRDDRIGLLGAKLLDHVDAAAWQDRLPIQHLGVFMKPSIENGWLRPYESRATPEMPLVPGALIEQPAVTGAIFAMRRADFEAVGGFDEGYSYGLEDVDLCFKVTERLGKKIICDNGLEIIHHRGFSRNKDTSAEARRQRNNALFNQSWASWLRRNIRNDVLTRPGFWTGARPVVGFVVTDTETAGDYYTALELGRALQEIEPVHLRYLSENEWQDLAGIDILIVMVTRFDITKVKAINPYALTINWTRQWFDRWAKDPSIHAYDHVWASSQRAADYLAERIGRDVDTVPIASNYAVFSAGARRAQYESDWCFTGSYFNLAREIQFQLDPAAIHGKGIVFGHNWEGTPFEPISVGPVPYSELPDVYASTKIVIDDANIATKPWGSCNSRVFDALAAGCLLITNGDLGAQELFGDLVPTFHDRESLTQTLNYWLAHEDERLARVATLQKRIAAHHSYAARARQVTQMLRARPAPMRIAIKCAAPRSQNAQWGDFHFAESLAAALRRTGAIVRVDCRENWYGGIADTDDAVIVLRGLLAYKLQPHQKNIMWLISHPDELPLSELQQYDQIFVASAPHAQTLAEQCAVPIDFLPQCTDTERFRFDEELVNQRPERVLFVGNSRGHFRESIRWSVEHGLDIDIYGGGWEPFITDDRLKGNVVPNRVLGELYASSRIVLCDHWADMRDKGYVSNRVFDVLAVGGRLVVDDVAGMADLVPAGYDVFRNAEELAALINRPDEVDVDERARLAEWVKEHHSFDARARKLFACCEALCGGARQLAG